MAEPQREAARATPADSADSARKSMETNIGGDILEKLLKADLVIRRASPPALALMGVLERGLALADAISELRKMLSGKIMERIYDELYGSPLGFRADRPTPKQPAYSIDDVRECVIEALMKGLMVVGNEWNIISQRCYVTREGFTRLLREYPNLTDLRISVGVPELKYTKQTNDDGTTYQAATGAVVPYTASWMIDGVQGGFSGECPVKMNAGMGIDAVLGKADRKIKCRIYCQLTGTEWSVDGEVDSDDIRAPAPQTSAARASLERMRADNAAKAGAEAPAGAAPLPQPAAGTTPPPAPVPVVAAQPATTAQDGAASDAGPTTPPAAQTGTHANGAAPEAPRTARTRPWAQ